MSNEKVLCRSPRLGATAKHIDSQKFELVRKAILKVVPKRGNGVPFGDLASLVKKQLTAAQRANLGSISWYTTTVKLEMETRGELSRVTGMAPQHLVRILPHVKSPGKR